MSVLDKIAIRITDFKLVLPDASVRNPGEISDVGIQVNNGLDSIFGPVIHHTVPLRILVPVQLPVPEKSLSFVVLVLSNPVLHPDSNHGQT